MHCFIAEVHYVIQISVAGKKKKLWKEKSMIDLKYV